MAKCPNCGAELKPSAKRCSIYGLKLDSETSNTSSSGAKLDSKTSNKFSSKMIITVIAVIAIIAIVGAFASGIFTNNNGAVDTANDESSTETVDSVSQDNTDDKSSSSESSDTEYWASAKTDKFHLPDCEWAEKISDDNKIIYDSREDAIADGKEPCNVCNP